ncbi:MAG: helix-turn-helix domain-containing protein, partial [Acidimicrobiales bacterium]
MTSTLAAPPLRVSDEQRATLRHWSRSSTLAHRTVVQAKALLLCADGAAIYEVARRLEVGSNSVRRWRRRFEQDGLDSVGVIAPGRGRKPSLPEGTVAEVVNLTRNFLPQDGSTEWSTRSLGRYLGISHDTVARIWKDHGLQPWKVDSFKVSNDPHFEE